MPIHIWGNVGKLFLKVDLKSPPFGMSLYGYKFGRSCVSRNVAFLGCKETPAVIPWNFWNLPNFIFLFLKKFEEKKGRWTTTHLPICRPHLTFSNIKLKQHNIFLWSFFPTHGASNFFWWDFWVVGLLQEQVAPRGSFPSTTDDTQKSLQKSGANLGCEKKVHGFHGPWTSGYSHWNTGWLFRDQFNALWNSSYICNIYIYTYIHLGSISSQKKNKITKGQMITAHLVNFPGVEVSCWHNITNTTPRKFTNVDPEKGDLFIKRKGSSSKHHF